MKSNISIIGMAGVGKSSISKQLASALDYEYIETDQLMNEAASKIGKDKSHLSDSEFLDLQESTILTLEKKDKTIIDTGGGVIYSPKAMKVLDDISFIVYFSDSPENIKRRFDERGKPHLVGLSEGMSFTELLDSRKILYDEYKHIEFNVSEDRDELIKKIVASYKN